MKKLDYTISYLKDNLLMVKVGNNIKVLYRKAFKEVVNSVVSGEMYLFNNNVLLDPDSLLLLKGYIFTGVSFEDLSIQVDMQIFDLNDKPVEYILHKNFICVKYNNITDINFPVAIVNFVPKTTHWAGGIFYAHFIELHTGGYNEGI